MSIVQALTAEMVNYATQLPSFKIFQGNPRTEYVRSLSNGFLYALEACLTWDQAQFERFSHILSNGYR